MNLQEFFKTVVGSRLRQPSTWMGIATAVLTLSTTGISALPTVLGPLLLSLGLIASNA